MRREVRSLTLHQLDIFAAVAREGSFTRAAESLMLSTPAVSQQMTLLERAVGAKLFHREPRKAVGLSDSGRVLLAACEQIFQQLDTAIEGVDRLQRGNQGRVSFGAGKAFCGYLLPSLYASFQVKEPGIALDVETGQRSDQLTGLLRGHLDLAILGERTEDARLKLAPLADHDLVLIGPPGHPLAGGRAPLEAVISDRLILTHELASRLRSGRDDLARLAAGRGVELSVGWEVGTVEAQIHAVSSGLGIALVPHYVVASDVAAGAYCLLAVEGFPIRTCWYLAWLSGRLSAAAASFRDHLLHHRAEIESLSLFRGREAGMSLLSI